MIEFHDVYETPEALEVLYRLMQERSEEPQINISHTGLPDYADHCEFVASRPYYCWYLVRDGQWLGSVNVTMKNEIGIFLFRAFRGKRYGEQILRKLIAEVKPLTEVKSVRPGHFTANINPENTRSIRLFEKIGFRHACNVYAL